MPTGYTAKLMEKGQTFPEFAMLCARAFGANVMMRDDAMDAEIKDYEPSDYHKKRITEDREQLNRLLEMSKSEREAYGNLKKQTSIASTLSYIAKEKAENDRLAAMEKQVEAWEPPTAEHNGLKEFMLQQINISKQDTSYWQKSLSDTETKPAIEFYNDAVSECRRSVERNVVEDAKEIERTNSRNDWNRKLRESL